MQHNNNELFSDKSDVYRRARPRYPDALIDYLAGLCDRRNEAWDCACGNGQAAHDIADRFAHVYATDISSQQLDHALTRSNISYSVSAAESTGFSDQQFDLITVAQALHWFDFKRFWPEVQRVIKPGGVFAAWGYSWPIWGEEIEPVITKHLLNIIEPYFADNNRLLWNHYKDVAFPFERINTPHFKMTVTYTLAQLFDFMHSTSAARRCMQVQGDAFFQHAYECVKDVWGNPNDRRSFDLDFVLIVGRY